LFKKKYQMTPWDSRRNQMHEWLTWASPSVKTVRGAPPIFLQLANSQIEELPLHYGIV